MAGSAVPLPYIPPAHDLVIARPDTVMDADLVRVAHALLRAVTPGFSALHGTRTLRQWREILMPGSELAPMEPWSGEVPGGATPALLLSTPLPSGSVRAFLAIPIERTTHDDYGLVMLESICPADDASHELPKARVSYCRVDHFMETLARCGLRKEYALRLLYLALFRATRSSSNADLKQLGLRMRDLTIAVGIIIRQRQNGRP